MLSFSGGEGRQLSGFRATVPTAEGNIVKLIVWAETRDSAKVALNDHRNNSNTLGIADNDPDFIALPDVEVRQTRRDLIANSTVWLEGYVKTEPVQQ
jgi:hypothetical protein